MYYICRTGFALVVLALTTGPILAQVHDSKRVWKPDATSDFEVGTQIRAWTIADEGMDYILDNMQSMCGVNSLYMVVVMHHTNQHG